MLCILPIVASFFISPAPTEATETTEPTEKPVQAIEQVQAATPKAETTTAFAGEITRNRVRMRAEPHLGGHIIRELNQGELFVVDNEREDFYALKPDPEQKAYIFRTYVLDGIVEGERVNVRLEPNLDAPVIAQLNTGDKVEGRKSEENSKWLEIDAPESVRFYVSKSYVRNIGPENVVAERAQRSADVDRLLREAMLHAQAELENSFTEIDADAVLARFEKVKNEYKDFDAHVVEATDGANLFQEAYLEKKIAFLEQKANRASQSIEEQNAALNAVVQSYQQRLAEMERRIHSGNTAESSKDTRSFVVVDETVPEISAPRPEEAYVRTWMTTEELQYQTWKQEREQGSIEEFYQEENLVAETLSGTLKPYNQLVKNRPGDFILVDKRSQRPIAFLYSTKVNLQENIGKEVTLRATERPNNHFAFPAYHVLSVE